VRPEEQIFNELDFHGNDRYRKTLFFFSPIIYSYFALDKFSWHQEVEAPFAEADQIPVLQEKITWITFFNGLFCISAL
jgi:hypothetical protein